jgi:CDP-paratose 2-epimerase
MRFLVTGGAGFVGSNLAVSLKRAYPAAEVLAFDNLKRRGSELALSRLSASGVRFVHGDVRSPGDLAAVGGADAVIECAAEPSVHAAYDGSTDYLVQTNLMGTVHLLEYARRHRAAVVLLSTSRVYPIGRLRALPLVASGDRLVIEGEGEGWSAAGVSESFLLEGPRSLYGATKLASELLVEEYREMYGLTAVVNRCGVIAGPWQMGKVDQGFAVLWAARHLWGGALGYTGFGGEGRQVRDLLHVDDLCDLVKIQLERKPERSVYNVGGGASGSASLREVTALCAARSQPRSLGSDPTTRPADIPWYVSDHRRVSAETGWRPQRTLDVLFEDIFAWLRQHEDVLRPILG